MTKKTPTKKKPAPLLDNEDTPAMGTAFDRIESEAAYDPKMVTTSKDIAEHFFWKALAGEDYLKLFDGRFTEILAAQEAWLKTAIETQTAAVGEERELKVLEIGCGPGRLAKVLADDCDYLGFDISEAMIAPLVKLIEDGVFPCNATTDPTVVAATAPFDVVFSVSMLIHNPPDQVRGLLKHMTNFLGPKGTVWLIENTLHVGESNRISEEHAGCWFHDYNALVPEGWYIACRIPLSHTHDIYVLERK